MDRTVELTDPRALRALAHPTRLHLVGLLRRRGPLTATQAGAELGESAASCSFHLRQLARWGLVEEAGGGRGRERPWRATASSTSWSVGSPEEADPAAALSSLIVDEQLRRVLDFFARMPAESADWQRAHQLADTGLTLTAGELEELGTRVWELVRSYERPPGREGERRAVVHFAGYPLPEGES